MAPTLINMPTELFDMVCRAAASTRSLKALRLTSSDMRDKTENVFADRTFASIELPLHEEKLEYLLEVAHHITYSNLVYTICIVPSYTYPPSEQNAFREGGYAVELLSEILPLLKNLGIVEIGRRLEPREQETYLWNLANARAGEPAYRLNHLCMTDRSHRSNVSAIAHGFSVLIGALDKSQKKLDKISAGSAPYNKDARNSIDHMVLELPLINTLKPSLESLRQLDLVLEIRSRSTSVHSETYLAQLLNQTTNLESLSLSFPDTDCAWLAGLPGVTLPSLTSLTINKAHRVSSLELYDFMTRHRPFKSLKLILLQFNESDPFKGLAERLLGLRLNEIHLQQLTCLHPFTKTMLFGHDLTMFCTTCYEDVEAALHYVEGPECPHATLSVKGEHEVYDAI